MKLFKNCPHDRRRSCEGCPMLTHCMIRKTKRRIKRKVIASKEYKMSYVLLLILFVIFAVTVVTIKMQNDRQKRKLEQDYIISSQVIIYPEEETIKESTCVTQEPVNAKLKVQSSIIISKETETSEEPKEELKSVISAYAPSDDYYYVVTDEEKLALEKLVYKESRGEPFEGQVAVAAVALNRYVSKSKDFDTSSIIAVIKDAGQFADISNVTKDDLEQTPKCKEAVDAALRGWDPTRKKFENGALYFYEPNLVDGYQKQIREGITVYQIGNHNFHVSFEK